MRTSPTALIRWIEVLVPQVFLTKRGAIRGETRHRGRRRSRWLLFWMAVAAVGVAARWLGVPSGSARR